MSRHNGSVDSAAVIEIVMYGGFKNRPVGPATALAFHGILGDVNARVERILLTTFTRLLGDRESRVVFPVLSGPAKGLRFRFDLLTRLETALLLGTYEKAELALAAQICQPGWTVWDCGSYMGYYTALFARLVGPQGRVVAFEADFRNLARTKEHIALNQFSNVQFVHTAIGPPVGQTEFILSNNTNSHIPSAYVGATQEEYRRDSEQVDDRIRVRCLSLDQACAEENLSPPDLIKIDIDGAEKEALPHAYKIAKSKKPFILLELHNPECSVAAWEFAQKTGYSLQSIDDRCLLRTYEEASGTLLCVPPP